LAKKIILSGTEKDSRPFISFIMSLAFTGMGEAYSGHPMRGIIFALLRVLSCLAVPFQSMINTESPLLSGVFISIILFILITLISPLYSLYLSLKNKKIILSGFNTTGFYCAYMILSIIITVFSISVFTGTFSILKIQKTYSPFIERGDIILIKKIGNQTYKKGDLVIRNDSPEIIRIIGVPGEKVTYNKGRFSIDNTELNLSIFNDMDLKSFSLTEYNVIAESNSRYSYPVIQNPGKLRFTILLKDNQYYAAPDDRNETESFQIIIPEKILGRAEGILFSPKRSDFLIKPLQINQ
jgi:signal peptidase I